MQFSIYSISMKDILIRILRCFDRNIWNLVRILNLLGFREESVELLMFEIISLRGSPSDPVG